MNSTIPAALSTSLRNSERWAASRVHWEYLGPIAVVNLLALLAFVPWYFSWSGVAVMILFINVFGTLGINLCYHRLLAHRSLTVPLWLERTLATIAICSLEDTPARWVATHRLHHVHSDEEPDPHSPRDGIGWSHVGWLFTRGPMVAARFPSSRNTLATSSQTTTTAILNATRRRFSNSTPPMPR